MKLSKQEREELRMMFGGMCAYCGIHLIQGWHADHVKAVRYGVDFISGGYDSNGQYTPSRRKKNGKMLRPENDTKDNLFPSCRACNIDKGGETLEDWRGYLQNRMINVMRQSIPNFRHAERFERITINTQPLLFWFERYTP